MRTQAATETDAQRVQREAAERNSIASTQDYLRGQTRHMRKLRTPRVSLANRSVVNTGAPGSLPGDVTYKGNIIKGDKFQPAMPLSMGPIVRA